MTTGLSAGAWFSREAKLPSAVGRTQVTTARALRHLPGTDQAWLDGRITREHVRVLAAAANPRIRDQIATLEPELIGIAEDRTFHHWRLKIAEVVARLDTEGPDPDDPTHSTATWGRSGLFAELRAKFAGADVELLEQIVEARTNALYRTNVHEHKQTSDIPLLSRSQLRALAIIDLILHGHDTDEDDDDRRGRRRRRPRRRRERPRRRTRTRRRRRPRRRARRRSPPRPRERGRRRDRTRRTRPHRRRRRDGPRRRPRHRLDIDGTLDDELAGDDHRHLDDEAERLIDDVRDDETSRDLEHGTSETEQHRLDRSANREPGAAAQAHGSTSGDGNGRRPATRCGSGSPSSSNPTPDHRTTVTPVPGPRRTSPAATRRGPDLEAHQPRRSRPAPRPLRLAAVRHRPRGPARRRRRQPPQPRPQATPRQPPTTPRRPRPRRRLRHARLRLPRRLGRDPPRQALERRRHHRHHHPRRPLPPPPRHHPPQRLDHARHRPTAGSGGPRHRATRSGPSATASNEPAPPHPSAPTSPA